MEHMSNIKSKLLSELKEMADEQLELRLDQTDIDAINTPKIFNIFHKEYRLVSQELITKELAMKKLYKDLWLYYSCKGSPEVIARKGGSNPSLRVEKSHLKIFIEGDDEFLKLLLDIEMTKNKKSFLQRVLDQINQRNWHIRNAIETMKFKNGSI